MFSYRPRVWLSVVLWLSAYVANPLFAAEPVDNSAQQFVIYQQQQLSKIYIDNNSDPLIKWAVDELRNDIKGITGSRPELIETQTKQGSGIYIGHFSDALMQDISLLSADTHKHLDAAWESFSLSIHGHNLVLAGSDVRGTVYAVFELAERLGISPWTWWADVKPLTQTELILVLNDGDSFQSPSVQYRGIFLNDEDWGLQPWAAKTFEKEVGDIGPHTYEKIFQLLLRLKANTIWPAMHPSTQAFFTIAGNQQMAERYHIVLGSSHAEPMLRNNVGEWDHTKLGDYNYFTNSQKINAYWQTRVDELGSNESIMTLGMRGVHDSHMEGSSSIEQSVAMLEQIIATQRQMLSQTLNQKISDIPQVMIPYKEVLELYQHGLVIPDDVTLMWTDDNYGYIRRLSEGQELQRSGGGGVYYHLSYWGRPHDYLWLSTTQPSLIWYEMSRAYANGAQKMWIANVGDIKPAEYNMELFLDLAWNVDSLKADSITQHLEQWAAREFGHKVDTKVAAVMNEYYRLAMLRKPEYMGWSQTEPTTQTQISDFSDSEAINRISAYNTLVEQVDTLVKLIPAERRSAWFQLVEYPLKAAAAMNNKFLYQQLFTNSDHPSQQVEYKHKALQAYGQIEQLTLQYNQLEQGKWQHMMSMSPRNLPVFKPPTFDFVKRTGEADIEQSHTHYRAASQYSRHSQQQNYQWQSVQGLGYSATAITLSPFVNQHFDQQQPWLEYDINIKEPGDYQLELRFLPTHANDYQHQVSVAINGKTSGSAKLNTQGRSEEWKTNVLRNAQIVNFQFRATKKGLHNIRVGLNQTGIVLDQLAVYPASQSPAYEIPVAH
ncbi:glycosyl hydrolase 115 family protein [Paraglaciecola hydrolytica]|uniref:Glycosyl hydrolase n=1 Tax=Paraglaciecola hydrolytica TaxID=1799789 RepID=A0A148KMV0_9ALTE|nr:glycosyl hydrolase 115 family protein [Paraglaciecola hydrolytica]KXI27568.1 glycosyl hydrolase [Paraglaciecola hydrolytica]